MSDQSHRNTIAVEQCQILSHQHCAGAQHIMRLQAPTIAQRAVAGSFVHLQVDSHTPMRRPISIMRVNQQEGWIELLYKVFGSGTAQLSQRQNGESIDLIGPIGNPFTIHAHRTMPLLIGGGVGMPPMIFIADTLRQHHPQHKPVVILGSEVPFPFTTVPSKIMVSGMPADVIATMPLLEDWNIPTRLTSTQGYPGVHDGYVTDLARIWLDSLTQQQRDQVEIYSCGPHPMLAAVAKLAEEYAIPCQVSLEEFMACGVGGCAGCVVEVVQNGITEMKRVCVDGPVFNASQVVW